MDGFNEYVGLLAAFMFALVTATGIIVLNRLLGPKHKSSPAKSEPFECGVEPLGPANRRLPVKFYLIAMLFILFDVEIVWLFPWAVALRELGWPGIIEMFSFIFVLVLGFAYAWRKGALEWER